MDPVRYRILGTTQALRPDGTLVPVGGARLRALLTVLALRAGRTVPAGLLVEEVWGDGDPPADATGALQALVGRLRRTLGADAVASVDGGYRLAAAPDDIDLHRFERLAGEGARALADGDPAKAAVVLDALALWRGPALADLPDRTAEAARRQTRHLDVLRARHTAALALGHAEHSLPELTALCDTHPLDEPLQCLRLRALRDAGRTAEALAAYEAVRELLADRLGTDPGPELKALHGELLRPEGRGGPAPGGGRQGSGRFGGGGRPGSGAPASGRRSGSGAQAAGPSRVADGGGRQASPSDATDGRTLGPPADGGDGDAFGARSGAGDGAQGPSGPEGSSDVPGPRGPHAPHSLSGPRGPEAAARAPGSGGPSVLAPGHRVTAFAGPAGDAYASGPHGPHGPLGLAESGKSGGHGPARGGLGPERPERPDRAGQGRTGRETRQTRQTGHRTGRETGQTWRPGRRRARLVDAPGPGVGPALARHRPRAPRSARRVASRCHSPTADRRGTPPDSPGIP
nr:BTAD domain-containing putative transcriptional regulator [Streptomyces sp. MMG1533]